MERYIVLEFKNDIIKKKLNLYCDLKLFREVQDEVSKQKNKFRGKFLEKYQ